MNSKTAMDLCQFEGLMGDDGLFVAALLGAGLPDWCALGAASSCARTAIHCVHPILRDNVLAKSKTAGCSTISEFGKRILENCTEYDITVCWALLGETQYLPISSVNASEDPLAGNSLLHIALASKGNEAARLESYLLTRPGAAVAAQKKNIRGQTALHLCARYGRTKAARRILLRLKGVEVDALDQYEATPLMEAVRQEHSMMVRTLLARRADPNTFVANCHGHGDTPLIVAVRLKNVDITRQLVAAPGIDFHQKSMIGCPFGKEALDFAPETGELRNLLAGG